MSNQTVGLSYGVLSEPLSEQLDKQGLKYNKKKIDQFQQAVNAIHVLRFGSGLLTDSAASKMFQKLHKKIMSHVAEANGKSVLK